ncbi:MAG: hypothetical protein ACXWBH_15025 [Candidatus Angelobacter sp.]
MRTVKWRAILRASFLVLIGSGLLSYAQQPAEKKPLIETPSMRLAAARNVFITRTHGSRIPLDVIKSTLEGWGRFTFVESPDKADLIIEISSTGDSGVQVSSSSKVSPETGQEEKSSSTRKDISPTEVKMTVFDSRNKRGLWTATESVKFAMKEKAKENNLVDAAERLASKFHDRLEPPAAK